MAERRRDQPNATAAKSTPVPSAPSEFPVLLTLLRDATHDSRRRLEQDLDLLTGTLARGRLVTLLERLYGFVAVWESAAAATLDNAAFFEPRRKLELLRADLRTLGRSDAMQRALPLCGAAARLAGTPNRAWGSLYVMEEATLHGRLIGRHLAACGWLPAGRASYFDPYGVDTGTRWLSCCIRIAARPSAAGSGQVIDAAAETVALLHRWCEPAFAPPRPVSLGGPGVYT